MIADEDKLRALESELAGEFPTLRVERRRIAPTVVGSFLLIESGVEVGRYDIEISIPPTPKELPILREVGGKIPRTAERHINWENGSACLFVPDERWKYHPVGSSIVQFIKGPVREFLLWQAYYDIERKPLFSGRSHGADGVWESYFDELQTDDPTVVIKFLDYLISKKAKGHWDCYCGSRKRIRDCHFSDLLKLREKIPRDYARNSLTLLRSHPPTQAVKALVV
jgi:hypothetical protein